MPVQQFSPEQEQEAIQWAKDNIPSIADLMTNNYSNEHPVFNGLQDDLLNMYFKLKTVTIPFKPNQFVVGVEYKEKERVIDGEEKVNLSFWNPHIAGQADQFAKEVLIHILTTLVVK